MLTQLQKRKLTKLFSMYDTANIDVMNAPLDFHTKNC